MAAADDNNPLYCPHISKLTYLEGLNQYVTLRAQGSHRPTGYRESRLRSDDSHSSDRILGEYFASGNNWFPTPGEDVLPPYSSTVSDPSLTLQTIPVNLGPTITRLPVPRLKRKSSETFSDFGAPPKYARSLQSIHDSSFEIEVRRQRLLFSDVPSSPVAKTEVHGDTDLDPAHNLDSIIDALELMLPGIRLGERLRTLDSLTPQIVMDFLVENDHLNIRTLDVLRFSDVEKIRFLPSVSCHNGLNLCGNETYSIFNKPNAFQALTRLDFTGTRLRDSDLVHIHHLPKLSVLLLDETGIGNEAIFLLVPLKSTLTRLSLSTNPDIDNDAVPALLLLHRLSVLSLLDTAIDMEGFRRIAEVVHRDHRVVRIKFPFTCEYYIKNLNTKYLVQPHPPLLTNEKICSQLSTQALQRNLEAHAACNPAILASGTRMEMLHRLKDILKTRALDKLVLDVFKGNKLVG